MLCRSAYVLVNCITAPYLTKLLFAIFDGENRALNHDMVGLGWDNFFKNMYLDIKPKVCNYKKNANLKIKVTNLC